LAWLSGSFVSEKSEMLIPCCPRILANLATDMSRTAIVCVELERVTLKPGPGAQERSGA